MEPVARGQLNYVYPHPNSGDGYAASAEYHRQMLHPTSENVPRRANVCITFTVGIVMARKEKMTDRFSRIRKCLLLHGLTTNPIISKSLPVGKAFHTITYGKGLMGSHAFMLDPEERWKVIHFVKSLAINVSCSASSDSTSTAAMTATDTLNSNSLN